MSAFVVAIDSVGSRVRRPTAWQPGQSGNPAGRPKGSRNRANLAVEELQDLLGANAAALGSELVGLARAGNMVALRLCIDRLMPAPRNRPVNVELPAIENAGDAAQAHLAVLGAVCAGELAPAEGLQVGRVIEATMRALERAEMGGG